MNIETKEQTKTADNALSSELLLRECVQQAMRNYFTNLGGHQPGSDIFGMVMTEVETPLLEEMMRYTNHNQSRAAKLLGINRGTLRSKLKKYGVE